jgi:hypothetical protein
MIIFESYIWYCCTGGGSGHRWPLGQVAAHSGRIMQCHSVATVVTLSRIVTGLLVGPQGAEPISNHFELLASYLHHE